MNTPDRRVSKNSDLSELIVRRRSRTFSSSAASERRSLQPDSARRISVGNSDRTPLRTPTRTVSSSLMVNNAEEIDKWLADLRSKRELAEAAVWNNYLIDYFDLQQMIDGTGRINYRKAAIFLESSVKLYKNRVVSIREETSKLVSGLNRVNSAGGQQPVPENSDGDANPDDSFSMPTRQRAKPKKQIILDQKKLSIEGDSLVNSTDPLFRKQQVEFDKGGAGALLMNSICPDSLGRLCFEDSKVFNRQARDENEMVTEGTEQEITSRRLRDIDDDGYVDVDLLHFATTDFAIADSFDKLVLCPRLDEIKMRAENPNIQLTPQRDVEGDEFKDEQSSQSNYDYIHSDTPMNDAYEDDIDLDVQLDDEPAEVEHNTQQMLAKIQEEFGLNTLLQSGNWRLNRLLDIQTSASSTKEPRPTRQERPRRERRPIDFSAPAPDLDELFAPSQKKSINLSREKLEEQKLTVFSVTGEDFARMFIKPEISTSMQKALLAMRGASNLFDKASGAGGDTGEEESDIITNNDIATRGLDAVHIEEPEEFDHSFGAANAYDDSMVDLEEPLDLIPNADRPRDEHNDVMSRIKVLQRNVDIRKLKDNIWETMSQKHKPDIMLSEVMVGTNERYNAREKSDLVTPLYFLNVLHLANEQGLDLQSVDGFKDLAIHLG